MSSAKVIRFPRIPAAISLVVAGALAESARLEREQACEEAYRRGFDEATDFLNAQVLEQRGDLAHLQESTLRAIADQQAKLAAQVSALLPELAIEIARRVFAGIEPDREAIQRICVETLDEIAPGSADVELRLSPRDFELVRGLQQDFSHQYPGIRLRADSELAPGDCRASSRFGEIDGRIATKLHNVARSLV